MATIKHVKGGPSILKQIADDEELRAKIASEDAEIARLADRAKMVALEGWLAAYHGGQVTLEGMCRGVVATSHVLPGSETWKHWRHELIGYAVEKAIQSPPEKQGRKNAKPEAFKRWAAELVPIVRDRESLPITQGNRHGMTAYARVAEILKTAGIRGVTERTVRKWHDESHG